MSVTDGFGDSVNRSEQRAPTIEDWTRDTTPAADSHDNKRPLGRNPGTLIGRFTIEKKIGSGGMGVVYQADDPHLERKVALKMVRSHVGKASTQLISEARVLARLSHPNVVAIYDADIVADDVYIAMELVDGPRLSDWLQTRRSWRDILAIFVQCGHGLRAAHEANIVHRDFKPENVLIGPDERPRVLDFGIAQLRSPSVPPPPDQGPFLGTPAYMSPEQHLGGVIDARSDQFSFCVALYSALYRTLPFPGKTATAIAQHVMDGQVVEPAAGTKVPTWLRRVLLRGLQHRPDDRYPDMKGLLGDLEAIPARHASRRRMALGGVVVVGALAIGVSVGPGRDVEFCQDGASYFHDLWTPARRSQIADAFEGSGSRYSKTAWTQSETSLGHYVDQWIALYQENCASTHLRGDQSADLLDRRMACLNRRVQHFSAILEAFSDATPRTVRFAADTIETLAPVSDCTLIKDPAPHSLLPRKPKSLELERELAGLSIARVTDASTSMSLADEMLARSQKLGDPTLEAEIRFERAKLYDVIDDQEAAEREYSQVLVLAKQVGATTLEMEVETELANFLSDKPSSWNEAKRRFRSAEALGVNFPQNGRRMHHLAAMYGAALRRNGELESAAIHLTRAAQPTQDRPAHPTAQLELAEIAATQGKATEAFKHAARALESALHQWGPEHPNYATFLLRVGIIYASNGAHDRAKPLLERSRAILESDGMHSTRLAVLSIMEIGNLYGRQGKHPDAFEFYAWALELAQHSETDLSQSTAFVHLNIGILEMIDLRYDEAIEHLEEALSLHQRSAPTDHSEMAPFYMALGNGMAGAQRWDEARKPLERALSLASASEHGSFNFAETEFALARTLQRSKSVADHRRALELATHSADALEVLGEAFADEVRRWIKDHKSR